MLTFPPAVRIWLALAPADLPKGFDALAELVRQHLRDDPLSGHVFVFRNRCGDRIKLLYWDTDGYVIVYKKQESYCPRRGGTIGRHSRRGKADSRPVFSSLNAFLDRLEPFLAAWPADVPLAVAVRNKTWVAPAQAAGQRRHRAVWVLPDQVWMPSPLSLVQRPDLDVVTGPFAYIRLLGDREAVDALTPTLDHVVIDHGPEVEMDAQAIQVLR
jgi:hypothetical protein